MRFKISSFLLLSVLLFSGCSFSPNELRVAERMMSESPDSALHVLQRMQSVNSLSDDDRALYGLLYFEALDKNNESLQPDSLITFSLNYYQSKGENKHLAKCFFYKARMYKLAQRFDNATLLYLKALDIVDDKNYFLLGKIYSDMGDICLMQQDYKQSLKKFRESIAFFNKAGNKIEASYKFISIGKVYHFQNDFRNALKYYKYAISQTVDSMLNGFAYQEIGINYYWAKQYDSAQHFLKKSLCYPYKGTNYAIRCINLADLFFDIQQYDSAFYYSHLALKYPASFFNQRDCYRILANTEYKRGDFKQMAVYMTNYQACSDSVRKIETQTKTTILEDIHATTQVASKTRKFLLFLTWFIPLIIGVAFIIVLRIRRRSIRKEKLLEQAEVTINQKQSLLVDNLRQKIEEMRFAQAPEYKKASPLLREKMDKELYNSCLHLQDWELFKRLMNSTFNGIINTFEAKYPDVTRKELIWCCLFLLDVSTPEMALILDSQAVSIYKLKQRLARKLNLTSTKDLDSLLLDFTSSR